MDRILGCLLASFRGPDAPDWLLRRLEAGLGGVCLFGDNIVDTEQLAGLVARLRLVRPGLVVAIDEEGGDVTRLEMGVGSSYPGNAALGRIDDETVTAAVAASIGADLAAVGITLDLAPCVDVNSNDANPVIGTRSFGSHPELVARHGAAFIRGLHEAGVAACAKHFPGHGDTCLDSHLDLPMVDAPLAVLQQRELVPFRAAVAAGVDAVMTSHVVLPALDDRPATLSPTILQRLLRDDLGFDGVIVTDALDMRGVSGARSIGEVAVDALAAGADLLCLGARQDDEVITEVSLAIERGLDRARLDEASVRVRALLSVPRASAHATRGISPAERKAIARRAIHVEGELPASLAGAHVVELRPTPGMASGAVPWGVADQLSARDPAISTTSLGPERPDDADLRAALDSARGRPLVIVVRDVHRYPWSAAALARLAAARPDATVVDLGWPGQARLAGAAVVRTYGASRASTEAVAALLLREEDLHG